MKAWTIDAGNIDLGEISIKDLPNFMVATPEIRDFLSMGTDKMFIVAPKGLGKTYLLKIKSQLYRDKAQGFKFIPNNSLCERFVSNEITFSEKDLLKFNERAVWKKTWELCLYTLILRHFNTDAIPNELVDVIGEDTGSLGEILGMFLQHRGKIEKLHNYVASHLKPAIRKLKDNSTANQIAIFIDNVDEAFDNYVGFEAARNGNIVSADLWINAQLSLLSVSKDLCAINSHIKIYLTIRSEAYNNFNDPQKLQIDSLCLFLEYSKDEIKEIFTKNIMLMAREDLFFPNDADKIRAFTGYSKIPHKFIEDEDGSKKQEDFFDFIYRHTYARPREIVVMGRELSKLKKEDMMVPEKVGTLVNKVSYSLFDQLTNEIIPVFEEDVFESLCKKVANNVIVYNDAIRIDYELKNEHQFNHAFSYFYRLGLIGVVQNEFSEKGDRQALQRQYFLPVGHYTLGEAKIPECQYFVLHPSLNKKMKQLHDIGFYDRFNIIGYDYPFNSQKQKNLEFHMHFGLDRDSLSTLVPEIDNAKCLAIVCPANSTWKDLAKSEIVKLELNEQVVEFKVFRDDQSEDIKATIFSDWANRKYHVVIYSTLSESILKFFNKVNTVSFCFYDPHQQLIEELTGKTNFSSKYFYYCVREYIKTEITRVKKALTNIAHDINFEVLLLDRFQLSQDVLYIKDEKLLKVIITAESYCKLICQDRPNASVKASEKIIRTNNPRLFEYYIVKQNLLSEGLYQFIKLMIKKGVYHEGHKAILFEFIHIQVSRILTELPEKILHELFDGQTRGSLESELKKDAWSIVSRVEAISHTFNYSGKSSALSNNKKKKIFPSDKDTLTFIRTSTNFYKGSHDFLRLLNILEVKPLKKYYNLFISYSFKDRDFANIIYDRLVLRGMNVTMYEKDEPSCTLTKYMHESVTENERMLFIASENSLKSDACHFELTTCFDQMAAENDDAKLTAIRLDNYILNPELLTNRMVKEDRKANIIKLRSCISINQFSDFNIKMSQRQSEEFIKELDEKLSKLVNQSYLFEN